MRISLDFDGVLSQTMELWCTRYNEVYPTRIPITVNDIKHWSFFIDFGMDVTQAFEIFDWCWGHWEQLPQMEACQDDKTRRLMELGEVDLVTSVDAKHTEDVFKWLKSHKIKYNNLVHKEAKQELSYDIFIDDSPINAVNIARQNKICLLYNQLWNRGLIGRNIIRVYSLDHAIDKIKDKLTIPNPYDQIK